MTDAEWNESVKPKASLKALLIRPAIYSMLGLLMYFVGKFSWWLGLILFGVFAVYIMVELLVNGSVIIVVALLLKLVIARFRDYRVLNFEKFGKIQKPLGATVGITSVMILIQLYYVLMLLLLGFYFFGTHS